MWNPTSWRRPCRLALYFGIAGLIVVSLMPGKALPRLYGLDLLYHALAYAGLAALAAAGYLEKRKVGVVMAGLAGLGILLEFAQGMVPGRSGSIVDAVANIIGISGFAALWWIWLWRLRHIAAGRN